MESLTPDVLRDLYLVQGLTETEISQRFGTNQVMIGRLRKRWGIPTMKKGERNGLGLPELTEFQKQVLIGSLLGDGHLSGTSDGTARFVEGHCDKQRAYVDWKADVFRPFISCEFDRVELKEGSQFGGRVFSTITCPQFGPFFDLFYPGPSRKRIFPASLPSLMTPLVLAVWYMDDGNRTDRGEPRIAFGLDDASKERAFRALRKIGLRPKGYGEGGDQAIHFPKQAMRFRELVEPFIISDMAHKLPTETVRQAGDRNARRLTPDKAAALYRAGMTVEAVADACGVGTGTVGRRLDVAGVVRRSSGPNSASLGAAEAAVILGGFDPARWASLDDEGKRTWAGEIKGLLRRCPFPSEPIKDDAATTLRKVRDTPMAERDGVILPLSRNGTTFCASFFPNRYKASWKGAHSAFDAWHDDKELERAIRFQLDVGDPVLPHRVLRAVALRCRTPTVFRPTVAMFMCRRFLPDGGTWWDPCAGYGGRLLGAAAAGVDYVGTDVDSETVDGNLRIAAVLGSSAVIVRSPAEDFDPPACGLVFTSPPYFNRERYSGDGGQSWIRHGGFPAWLEGFLRPVVAKARGALVPGGVLALNVADVGNVPLVAEAVRVAEEGGFVLVETLRMPLAAVNRKNPWEPVLVFRPV